MIKSAARDGLTVRESVDGRDIRVPWERLNLDACKQAHPWLATVHSKAIAGETVMLDFGLGRSPDDLADWRTVKKVVPGGSGANFTSLSLTAYVHREVAKPRLAIVWVGERNPLAKRGDAADFARRSGAALVLASFSGKVTDASKGSGEALVREVGAILSQPKSAGEKEHIDVPPALMILGEGDGAQFAWSFLVNFNGPVVAAVTVDGVHEATPNAASFATPLLLIETQKAHKGLEVANDDVRQPFDLWRHYSTEGCRWCYVNPMSHPDPLSLAVSFCQAVAAASPYREVLENLESWNNNELKNRIPMPTRTIKDFKETGFLLGNLGARQTFRLADKKGDARHDLIWLPGAEFARAVVRYPAW